MGRSRAYKKGRLVRLNSSQVLQILKKVTLGLASKAVAAKPLAMVPQKMSSVSLFLVVVSLFVLINFTDFAYSQKDGAAKDGVKNYADCDYGFAIDRDDTCSGLAQKCGVSLQTLFQHNRKLQWGNNCGPRYGSGFVCCTNWSRGRK
ncbi:uncharacterized protein LOC124350120 isoform X2 [Daphnia pulicaria]|uniref:uncharacterized protein LOC124350120 isoform X2 n=1 Tax=Daphnia pulicaria TaxID=35523 RepID=UPI001EEBFAE5|nr:uncharacterized protein LOC124350120 isoform X2 [Daphnia pulicaria]